MMRTDVFNQAGDRPGIPNIAILFVLSPIFEDMDVIENAAGAARASNIELIVVGVLFSGTQLDVRRLVSPPPRNDVNYFILMDYRDLEFKSNQILGM